MFAINISPAAKRLSALSVRREKISSNSLFAFYYAFSRRSLICSFIRCVLLAAFPGISQTQSECSEQTKARNTPHRADAGNKYLEHQVLLMMPLQSTKSWRLCRVHNCYQTHATSVNEQKNCIERSLLLNFDET